MRILFFIHELARNGAVVSLLFQVQSLIAAGNQVTVLVPALEGEPAAMRPEFAEAGAAIVQTTSTSDHDIAIGCTVFVADFLADVLGRIPLVLWIHEGQVGLRHFFATPKATQVLGHADRLIFPGHGVLDHVWRAILSELPPGRIEVIPPFVPPAVAGPAAPKLPGHARVLCVGTIYPRKRQSDLIAAVHALGANAPVQCVFAGHRMLLPPAAAETVAADPQRFTFAGSLPADALATLYRSADIFVLPSDDECLPIAPIEAASHGVPVVLSDLDCHAGIWKHGTNALTYPVGDVELLAWSLRMLLESKVLRDRLSASGREVVPRFGPSRTTLPFAGILAEVVAGWQGRRSGLS